MEQIDYDIKKNTKKKRQEKSKKSLYMIKYKVLKNFVKVWKVQL